MRLLVGWELGGGAGHLQTVVSIATALKERGHVVSLAVRDVPGAARLLGETSLPVYQAPVWIGKEPGLNPAVNYASVLFHAGYLQTPRVAALVRAWLALFDLLRPAAIVAEHSPTLLLAARVRGLPLFLLGTGFTLPPRTAPMADLRPWQPPPRTQLQTLEQGALQTVNEVMEGLGQPPLNALADLFHVQARYLCTFEELDHYGTRTELPYRGPLMVSHPLPPAVWPAVSGEKVFVYLHHTYRQFPRVLGQLQALGWPTLVVAPAIPPPLLGQMQTAALNVVSHPVDLDSVAAQCRLFMTHAAHGTVAEALRRAVAPIMLPNYVEQTVLAYRVGQRGLGLVASPDPRAHQYGAMLEHMLNTPRYGEQARAFAARYADFRYADAVAAVANDLDTGIKTLE